MNTNAATNPPAIAPAVKANLEALQAMRQEICEESPKRNFKGVWIPKRIWLDPNLTWLETCVLGEISSLSDEKEGCTASNAYFAAMFDVSIPRMANIISELHIDGYLIKRVTGLKGMTGPRRELWVSKNSPEKERRKEQKKRKRGVHEIRESPSRNPLSPITESVNLQYIEDRKENRERGVDTPDPG